MSVFQTLLLIQLIAIPVVFLSLLFTTAPYGRHAKSGWGPAMNSRWAWILMELPAVLTIAVIFLLSREDIHPASLIFLLIWEWHYIYRTFYFPFQLKKIRYDFPVLLVVFAVVFNVINGSINGLYLFEIRPIADAGYFKTPYFIAGLILFLTGFIIHVTSDRIILNLRKGTASRYAIPTGGLFRYITNPNYFGEFVQWCGWALLTWSVAGLAFALFTLANLLPRAMSNHRWYRQTFADYPRERKIFFPKIF